MRTGQHDLMLGKSVCDFMGRLGVNNDGGVSHRRLRYQRERLLIGPKSLHYRKTASPFAWLELHYATERGVHSSPVQIRPCRMPDA